MKSVHNENHFAPQNLHQRYAQPPPEAKDHALQGEWSDFRELHLGGDSLLIYQTDEQHVYLARLGSHAQLFKSM